MKTLTDHQFKLAQDELIRMYAPHEIASAPNREQRALMLYGRMHNPTVEDLKAFIDAINAENVPRPHGNVYMRVPTRVSTGVTFKDEHPYARSRKHAHVGTKIDPFHDIEEAMRRVRIDDPLSDDIDTAMNMEAMGGDVDDLYTRPPQTWSEIA